MYKSTSCYLYITVQSNNFSRFVQFGADQDCHCGAVGCREKLGVRPTKPKMSSVAALKLVACQVAVSSPKVKGMFSAKDVSVGLLVVLPNILVNYLTVLSNYW